MLGGLLKAGASMFGGPLGGAVASMIGGKGNSGDTSTAAKITGRDNDFLDQHIAQQQTDSMNRSEAQNGLLNFNNQLQIENAEKQANRDERLSHTTQNHTIQKTVLAKAESALNQELQKAQRG